MEIKNIIVGWSRGILEKLNSLELLYGKEEAEVIRKEAARKLKICETCHLRSGDICNPKKFGKAVKSFIYRGKLREIGKMYPGCNCSLGEKALSDSQCPLGKF